MYCAMSPDYGLGSGFLRLQVSGSRHSADLQCRVVQLALPSDEAVRCQHRDAGALRAVGEPVLLEDPLATVRPPTEQRHDQRPRARRRDLVPEGLVRDRSRLDEWGALAGQYRSARGYL